MFCKVKFCVKYVRTQKHCGHGTLSNFGWMCTKQKTLNKESWIYEDNPSYCKHKFMCIMYSKPNKPKWWSLEYRKVYCRRTIGSWKGGSCSKSLNPLKGFRKSTLKSQVELLNELVDFYFNNPFGNFIKLYWIY